MNKVISIFIAVIFILSSCKKDLEDPGATAAVKVANEWWVTLDQGGVQDVAGLGNFKIATYNTAANDNTIWVDDLESGWQVKFKATVDYSNLTFAAQNSPNEYYPITVTLTDGKILPKAGHSRAGNIVDSIHMKLEFSDDPGTIYEMNGVERTKLIEDDWP